ncbi:MAG: MgtC/SapB family protein [Clostridia bacterium]|nr:MgtC/SapB family protein [Clostridia bacterium]
MTEFLEIIKNAASWVWEFDQVKFTVDALVKLGITTILSGFIGFEREHSHRPAGFRTHILVAVGSALVMLTSVYVFDSQGMSGDVTRMSAQVLSGIGFLGAGTILREGFSVKGLTTAASLWAVACIGIAVGAGFYAGALVATFVIYLTLNSLKRFIVRGSAGKLLFIEIHDVGAQIPLITKTIKQCGGTIHSMEVVYTETKDLKFKRRKDTSVIKVLVFPKNDDSLSLMTTTIRSMSDVEDIYVD